MEEELLGVFKREFGSLSSAFTTKCFALNEQQVPDEKGGVYVFFRGNEVWKIGKSNTNALKRAMQHLADNTGSEKGKGMAQFKSSVEMKLLLFLINDANDVHWVLALEAFLEGYFRMKGNLQIESGRIG